MNEAAACAVSRALTRIVETPGPLDTPCWLWTASTTSEGYAQIRCRDRVVTVHRLLYAALVREPAAGIHLNHRCETRRCVNPAHLDEHTHVEHMAWHRARRLTCGRGHRLVVRYGRRICPTCRAASDRARYQRLAA